MLNAAVCTTMFANLFCVNDRNFYGLYGEFWCCFFLQLVLHVHRGRIDMNFLPYICAGSTRQSLFEGPAVAVLLMVIVTEKMV